jgi:gluconokinase
MGVAGSGKSTVGALLAGQLGVPYADADDFHSPANIAKMSAGIPLDDDDRRPWLDTIGAWARERADHGGVISCSALKRRYRDWLRETAPDLFFLHLDGSFELIADRMARREGHFMPAKLLRSQFAALEPLTDEECGAVIDIDGPTQEVVDRALTALSRKPPSPFTPSPSHRTLEN